MFSAHLHVYNGALFFLLQVKADQEIEENNTLFSNLINQVEEMQAKLRSNIQIKLRKSQEKDEAVIQELHDEIAELQRKHSELDELSQNEDHLWLLQVSCTDYDL